MRERLDIPSARPLLHFPFYPSEKSNKCADGQRLEQETAHAICTSTSSCSRSSSILAPIPTARARLAGLEAGTIVGRYLHSNSQTAADQLPHAKSHFCAAASTTYKHERDVNSRASDCCVFAATAAHLVQCREAVNAADTEAAGEAAERTAGAQTPPASGIRALKSSDIQAIAPCHRRATPHPALQSQCCSFLSAPTTVTVSSTTTSSEATTFALSVIMKPTLW